MIYLDYAASAPMMPEALAELSRCCAEDYANPGGLHREAGRARGLLHRSRIRLAELLGVPDRSVFFCSGGTEANNWAIRSGAGSAPGHLLIGACEHKSVLESAAALRTVGFSISFLQPDARGFYDPAAVEAALRPDTRLISIQAANNETGILQDVAAIAALASRRGIRYHCDAVQSFGHVSQPLREADLISLSAHKLGGPRGIGCLIVRQGLSLPPLIRGGGQELGLRSGTENTAGIASFAVAAEIACRELDAEQRRLRRLRGQFRALLSEAVPGVLFHEGAQMLPGIINCAFPGLSGEELLMRLDLKEICISTGAACASRDPAPSHVLLAMGCTDEEARRSVRFSLGRGTTLAELAQTAEAIAEIVRRKESSHV